MSSAAARTVSFAHGGVGVALREVAKRLDGANAQILIEAAEKVVRPAIVTQITAINLVDRGMLRRSFRSSFERRGESFTAGVYSDLPYANIHNKGGTIRPRRAKWLTVPMKRFPAGTTIRDTEGFFLRIYGTLFFVRKKLSGRGRARGEWFEPLWVLRKSVTIKGRGYLDTAAQVSASQLPDFYKHLMAEQMQAAIDSAAGSSK